MKKLWILLVVSTLFFPACQRKSNDQGNKEKSKKESLRLPAGKYGLKSGIVEYKSNIMGFDGSQTLYFDDYGNKEANETTLEMMGMKIQTTTIMKDGYIYNFDPVKKTGSKIAASPGAANIDFENLTEEMQEKMKLKEEGNETCQGKSCVKWSIDNNEMNMKGFYWVWKGIPLKVDLNMGTSKMLMEASSLRENAKIMAEKFEIPADINFQSAGTE